MKTLILASDTLRKRIKTLVQADIELSEVSSISSIPFGVKFDLAIVDVNVENADAACRTITRELDIPLVLAVKDNEVDWERFELLNASGFIKDTISRFELLARLNAVTRRYTKVDEP